jgi:hypothetical protein
MLSHQPEVSRLLQREHVQRLAADVRDPLRSVRLRSSYPARLLSRLAVAAHAALDVRHRRFPSRS